MPVGRVGRAQLGSFGIGVVVAALIIPLAVVAGATKGVVALLALAAVGALILRPTACLLIYTAAAPFDNLLAENISPSAIKALGGLFFASAVLDVLRRPSTAARGPSRASRPVRPADTYYRARYKLGRLAPRGIPGAGDARLASRLVLVFVALLMLATVFHPNAVTQYGDFGFNIVGRYLPFAGIFLFSVELLRDPKVVWRIVATYSAAVTIAGLVAVAGLVAAPGSDPRAQGPLDDPNDFALFLAVGVPLVLALAVRARREQRGPGAGAVRAATWAACAVILLLSAASTFSRGAVLGLTAGAVVALVTRVVPLRAVLVTVAAGVVAVTLFVAANPTLFDTAYAEKSHIAASNVDTRAQRWAAAIRMIGADPVLGVGPGGFRVRYAEFQPGYDPQYGADFGVVAHNTYLEVGAELGLPALGVFAAWLVLCLRSAGLARRTRQTPPGSPDHGERADLALLGGALQTALVIQLVGSTFLTEQYYLPLWLFTAAAVALGRRSGLLDVQQRTLGPTGAGLPSVDEARAVEPA